MDRDVILFHCARLFAQSPERKKQGVYGTAWQVHGGGFYHVEKFTVAPPELPPHLHWFQWEAYLTWATGFGLMIVQYYLHAGAYLIDPAVMALTPLQAIAISIVSLFAGWVIYDVLCRVFGERTLWLAIGVFALILLASVLYTKVYSGRGAFLHVGAFIGTIMAFNVFAVIIPNQKKMVAQLMRGEAPDARYGQIGKQRSLHNNYLTLPVLLMMVSPHYPFLSSHPQSWLIVALILISGGLFRHLLNRIDAGDDWNQYGWAAPVAIFGLICAIYLTAPAGKGANALNAGQRCGRGGDIRASLRHVSCQKADACELPGAAEKRHSGKCRRFQALCAADHGAGGSDQGDAAWQSDRNDRR